MKIIKNTLTGVDNETYDIARVVGAIVALSAVVLQAYITLETGVFDVQDFSIGMGTLIASIGLSVRLKQDSEPK